MSALDSGSDRLGQHGKPVDQDYDTEQHQPQTERQGQVALARLKGNGRGHDSGQVVDIPTDNDDCTHFSTGAAESCQDRCQQTVTSITQQRKNGPPGRHTQRGQIRWSVVSSAGSIQLK